MASVSIERAEWSDTFGRSGPEAWARYWVRRTMSRHSVYGLDVEDVAAEAVCTAYGRYAAWRAENEPEDVEAAVKSAVRRAAEYAVLDAIGTETDAPESVGGDMLDAIPDRERSDDERFERLIGELPTALGETAAMLLDARETSQAGGKRQAGSQRDMAKSMGISHEGLRKRIRRLKADPRIHDMLLAHLAEQAGSALG